MTDAPLKKLSVVFVDDEPFVVEGLARQLRNFRDIWDMVFVNSGPEALKVFAQRPVDVIVADMRMPEMNGAELLTQVMQNYPDTIRIVLSGHSQQEMIIKAVKCAHQFLTKPCAAEIIKKTIDRACALRQVLQSETLRKTITGMKTLPSLPRMYTQLTDALQNAEVPLKAVSEIIQQDVSMSAKILQLVNSAFFGLPNRVRDLNQAVTFLGLDALKALVLSREVFYSYKKSGAKVDTRLEDISSHSVAVAKLARLIGQQVVENDKRMHEDAFVSGLLHDIGKLVILQDVERSKEVDELVKQHGMVPYHAERRVFGASHAVIGAYLLSVWGLPDNVVEAVAFHHNPMDLPAREFSAASAVHIANAMMHERDKRTLTDKFAFLDYDYLEELRLVPRLASWMTVCRTISMESL